MCSGPPREHSKRQSRRPLLNDARRCDHAAPDDHVGYPIAVEIAGWERERAEEKNLFAFVQFQYPFPYHVAVNSRSAQNGKSWDRIGSAYRRDSDQGVEYAVAVEIGALKVTRAATAIVGYARG